MTIAVCDDELYICESIAQYIHILYPNAAVVTFADGESLLAYKQPIDIVFLDIQMQPVSGMEAARELRRRGSDVTIIFVTALEEYVYEAFDVNARHYLLKPIDKVKFSEVLRRAVDERETRLTHQTQEEPFLNVKQKNLTRRVCLRDIYYFEVSNRKVIIHMETETIEFYGRLSELEQTLGEDFVRCHRAYIVNMRWICKYNAAAIWLENGACVPLAKPKYADFVKGYMRYTMKCTREGKSCR